MVSFNPAFSFEQALLEGISRAPELTSQFKKDYGKDYILFINENLTFHEVEERYGLISEEYEFVSNDLWRRIGSISPAGGKVLDNGKRFNTHHNNDSIFLKTNCFDRTIFQEIFYRKGEANFFKTVKWIEEHFPELNKNWKLESAQEEFKIETPEIEEVDEFNDIKNEIYKKMQELKKKSKPDPLIMGFANQLSKTCPDKGLENGIFTTLVSMIGHIISLKIGYDRDERIVTTNGNYACIAESGEGKGIILSIPKTLSRLLSHTDKSKGINILAEDALKYISKFTDKSLNIFQNLPHKSLAMLEDSLNSESHPFFIVDENSKIFEGMSSPTSPFYGLDQAVNTWFSYKDGIKYRATKGAGKTGFCYNPTVSLLLTTHPTTFHKAYKKDTMETGGARRFNFIRLNPKGENPDYNKNFISAELLKFFDILFLVCSEGAKEIEVPRISNYIIGYRKVKVEGQGEIEEPVYPRPIQFYEKYEWKLNDKQQKYLNKLNEDIKDLIPLCKSTMLASRLRDHKMAIVRHAIMHWATRQVLESLMSDKELTLNNFLNGEIKDEDLLYGSETANYFLWNWFEFFQEYERWDKDPEQDKQNDIDKISETFEKEMNKFKDRGDQFITKGEFKATQMQCKRRGIKFDDFLESKKIEIIKEGKKKIIKIL